MAADAATRERELIARASKAIDARDYAGAESACREVLKGNPRHVDAWYLLAGLALPLGRFTDAEDLARKAIAINSFHPGAWHTLGMAVKGLGRLQESAECFRRAVSLAPRFVGALNSLGIVLRQMGANAEARDAFQRALGIDARNAHAHHNLAMLLAEAGESAQAIAHYEQATAIAPGLADSQSNLGSLYARAGRRADAEARFRSALATVPAHPEANNNLGILLQQDGRVPESLAHFDAALAARPQFAAAHNNRGISLMQKGEVEPALEAFARAMALDPAFADPCWNRANLLRDAGRYEEARSLLEETARRFPASATATYALSLLDLLEGRLESGWQRYTWRQAFTPYELSHPPRPPVGFCPDRPAAPVESVDLIGEQGLGDVVFFARWAPRLREVAARTRFHGDARLGGLLERAGAIDAFDPKERWAHREGALELRAGDLPFFTGADRDIPPPLPLAALPERVEAMRRKLAEAGPAPYLGLTWRAGVKTARGYDKLFKEIPLEAFLEAAASRRATFVSLQREPDPADLAIARDRLGVADFGWANDDLEDALALLALLDDYVGVSNTNMHLRAGLGLPTRVLVTVPPEWRYGISGERSAFFPRATLYRQDRERGWAPALERLAYDLASPRQP